MERKHFVFPFTAIVGQTKAKLALILNAINPLIGGVLLRGDRGTGKSTMVRAFAQVLPEIRVIKNCPFNCNPDNPLEMCDSCYEKWENGEELPIEVKSMKVVDLPLNASIDRVVGSLDVRRALKEGIKALEPGILAEANRNILYIDEVNLLDDYIADVLLDAAASGWNIVEREGISVRHPARFILVGSMNPEEGELRPQILDRFGLVVEIEAITDPELRSEIVERVEEFSEDPLSFMNKFKNREEKLRKRILEAKKLLKQVKVEKDLIRFVAKLCTELKITTHRAEIITIRCAKALAAFNQRRKVSFEDIKQALELVLPHRLKRQPFEERRDLKDILRSLEFEISSGQEGSSKGSFGKFRLGGQERGERSPFERYGTSPFRTFYPDLGQYAVYYLPVSIERVFGVRKEFDLSDIIYPKHIRTKKGGGSRASRRTYAKKVGGAQGVYISHIIPKDPKRVRDVAIDATIRAAALRVVKEINRVPLKITDDDIRERVRRKPIPRLIMFILDSSGSMAALRRIELAKGILWNLAKKAYVNKDYVSLIIFRKQNATIVVEPTRNYARILNELESIPTGGKTPLSHALLLAYKLVKHEKLKHKDLEVSMIMITDGKANVPINPAGSIRNEIRILGNKIKKLGVKSIIVDTRLPFELALSLDLMNELVNSLDARHIKVPLPAF